MESACGYSGEDEAGEAWRCEMPVEHRATRDRLVAGRLDLHRDGYGFVGRMEVWIGRTIFLFRRMS